MRRGAGGGTATTSTATATTSITTATTANSTTAATVGTSTSSGNPVCASSPNPCSPIQIFVCPGPGRTGTTGTAGGCSNPVEPFDRAGVLCALDAYIAGKPAHVQVTYDDTLNGSPFGQYVTIYDYVLFGDGTVSVEEQGHQDLSAVCQHTIGTLRNAAYLDACKASTTDHDLYACFRGAIDETLPGGSAGVCTNHARGGLDGCP